MASRILCLSNNLRGISRRFKSSHAEAYKALVADSPIAEITGLDNGIRVASESNGSRYVSLGIYVDAGSRHEDGNNSGVANLLQQLVFKGTKSRTQAALEEEIASIGARLNSVTTREQTALVAKCLPQHVPKVVEILSDALQNPRLEDAQIDQARKVVLREIDEVETNKLKELTLENLLVSGYQGTPLGRPLAGTVDNINSFTKQDLENFIGGNYKGSRIVLAAAGDVDHAELVNLANKNLGKVENTFDNKAPELPPCRFTSSDIRIRDDSVPFAYFAIAFEAAGLTNDDHLVLELARHYLGSWDRTQTSGSHHPLTLAKLCDEEQICHSYESINLAFKDTALWGVNVVCDPLKCEAALHQVSNEVMRICNILSDSELARAKKLYKSNLLRVLESNSDKCNDIGQQVLVHGRRISFAEIEQKVNNITASQVRDVLSNYVYDRHPVISAVGQHENLYDLNRVTEKFFWWRT